MIKINPMDKRQRYWKSNLRYLFIFLFIWFVVGLVLPILAVDFLNQFSLAGWPLGVWFSFQGSLILFVILFFVYSFLMEALERNMM